MAVSKKNVKKARPAAAKAKAGKGAKKAVAKARPVAAKAKAGKGTKKAVAKKAAVKKAAKKPVRRVPPRIVPSPTFLARDPHALPPLDPAKARAFGLSIAEEMKRSAAKAEAKREKKDALVAIKLSRRPTTRAQGKATVKFPASDLREFRKRLVEARAKALSGVDAMKATGFNETEDREADGGDGTNQTLRLQALGQMGNIHRTLQQIEEALHRIDDGTYGVCTACGQLIRKPRLLNQPFVLTCMECQSEMERGRD